jgi:hypothetical protein
MGKSFDEFMLEIDVETVKGDQFRNRLRVAHEQGLLVAALQGAGIAHLYPLIEPADAEAIIRAALAVSPGLPRDGSLPGPVI